MLFNQDKHIIILFEKSGVFTGLYRGAGYTVHQFDIQIDGKDARIHIPYTKNINVYGLLAFPPCDHLAASGARWWKEKGDKALIEALSTADVVARFVTLYKPEFWAMENPVGRLSRYYGPPRLIFNPCDYGDPYTKKTCLWGNFRIPAKTPVEATEGSKMHRVSPSPERKNIRSQTPMGFAKAFFNANK